MQGLNVKIQPCVHGLPVFKFYWNELSSIDALLSHDPVDQCQHLIGDRVDIAFYGGYLTFDNHRVLVNKAECIVLRSLGTIQKGAGGDESVISTSFEMVDDGGISKIRCNLY